MSRRSKKWFGLLFAAALSAAATGICCVGGPSARTVYADEEDKEQKEDSGEAQQNNDDDDEEEEERARKQLQAYKESQYLQLEAKINAAKESNHLSDSTRKELDGVLGTARAQIFGSDTQTLVDGVVGSATTLMEGLVKGNQTSTHNFLALTDTYQTPTVSAGQKVSITLPVISYADSELSDVVIRAVVDNSVDKWPFVPNSAGAVQTIKSFPPYKNTEHANNIDMSGVRQDITFNFTVRDDVKSGYYSLPFHFVYKRNGVEEEGDLTTYVKAIGKPGSGKLGVTESTDKDKQQQPRVIVTGFETNPARVNAGDTFTVTIHMQNTSGSKSVTNVLFDMQAAQETTGTGSNATTYQAFLPTSGASSVYVDTIPAGSTHELSIEMTARADLAEKPYVLNVKMKYDCGEQYNLEDTASVSIPIYQEARCETGSAEITPTEITVGNQSNIAFGVYNTGKTTLNNVWVRFKADSVTGGDTYLGNISPGGTGNLDAMVTGAAATTDDGTVIAEISFENDQGNVTTVEKALTLFVTEETDYSDTDMDFGMMEEPTKPEGGIKRVLPWSLGGIAAVAVVAFLVVHLLKKRREKAKDMAAIDDDTELLSGTGFDGKGTDGKGSGS